MSKIALNLSQNNELSALIKFLKKHTKRAYLVGGCVRDLLLGLPNSDFDIEIYDISSDKFDDLMKDIGASGVGKNYFVYKFKNFDLSLPRIESKNGVGHKAFDVFYCNDEMIASKRRDFTINSIMLNIFTGEILDFWGGKQDLKSNTLRVVDENSFKDDSLRVLRAVQFAARFALRADNNSLKIMQSIDISDLSLERKRQELEKFFKAEHQAYGVGLLMDLGLDKKLFGVKLSAKFGKKVEKHFALLQDSRVFLYDLIGEYRLDPKQILSSLSLGKFYRRLINEPFLKRCTKFDMMKISLNMSLSQWLGLNTKKRISLAKELGFYDKKFSPVIDISKANGLKSKELGKFIEQQKELAIKKYLRIKN